MDQAALAAELVQLLESWDPTPQGSGRPERVAAAVERALSLVPALIAPSGAGSRSGAANQSGAASASEQDSLSDADILRIRLSKLLARELPSELYRAERARLRRRVIELVEAHSGRSARLQR